MKRRSRRPSWNYSLNEDSYLTLGEILSTYIYIKLATIIRRSFGCEFFSFPSLLFLFFFCIIFFYLSSFFFLIALCSVEEVQKLNRTSDSLEFYLTVGVGVGVGVGVASRRRCELNNKLHYSKCAEAYSLILFFFLLSSTWFKSSFFSFFILNFIPE